MIYSAVVPRMQATAVRAGIICTSSASADFGFELNTVYSGSKGYNKSFAFALGRELGRKADVLALKPFSFCSGIVSKDEFLQSRVGNFFLESADNVARDK